MTVKLQRQLQGVPHLTPYDIVPSRHRATVVYSVALLCDSVPPKSARCHMMVHFVARVCMMLRRHELCFLGLCRMGIFRTRFIFALFAISIKIVKIKRRENELLLMTKSK